MRYEFITVCGKKVVGLCIPLILGLSACDDPPQNGSCQKLLIHRISLEVEQGIASADKKTQQKMALEKELANKFLERCNKNLKNSQVQCGIKATSMKALEACDE